MNKDFDQKISEIEKMFSNISGKQKRNKNVKHNQTKLSIVSNTFNEIFTNVLSVQDN